MWTSFAVKTVHTIADRSASKSRLSSKQTRKNLFQQVSARLWVSNVQMVLKYWAIQHDEDFHEQGEEQDHEQDDEQDEEQNLKQDEEQQQDKEHKMKNKTMSKM